MSEQAKNISDASASSICNVKYRVTGMTCSACSSRVEKCVSKLEGAEKVSVNLLTGTMQVSYDPNTLGDADVIKAVTDAGYGASLYEDTQSSTASKDKAGPAAKGPSMDDEIQNMKHRLIVSFAFLIPLMYVSMGHMISLPLPGFLTGLENAVGFALTQFLLSLPIIYVNRKYYQVGFKTLLHGAPNMDSLIAIGSTAALVYGIFAIYRMGYGLGVQDMELVSRYHMDLYFESATMILTLITLGKYFETKSKGKTSEAITKLMNLAPDTALVERSGSETEIPLEEVAAGDILIVKSGMKIPVDGFVLEGTATLDESAITGESLPVQKSKDDTVISATICNSGYLKFRATRVGKDTTLSQIIRLVEDASSSKAPIARLADKIAGIFVPAVILIALAATIIWLLTGAAFEFALSIGISVLVISCPCALGLATPVAIMVGTGKGAENGILIKSGEALETAHNIKTIVLDKTGTITEGKPRVTDVITYSIPARELTGIAVSLEKRSEHPLAQAVLEYGGSIGIQPAGLEQFTVLPGRGVSGTIQGTNYCTGNLALMEEQGILISQEAQKDASRLASNGKTPLYFAGDGRLLGIIAVADTVKPTSAAAISSLKDMGIHVVMLTGDNKTTAQAIQKQLDIPEVIAEVLPQEKEQYISKFQEQGQVTAMVGDGINDAPALARADVGIAIGAGTDVAIESADIVLMHSSLMDVVTAIRLSKAVIRNIRQNLFWAFFYNSVGIPLAAGVFYSALGWKLSPMFGAAAMSLSSVCVVSNALRLKLFKGTPVDAAADTQTADIVSSAVIEEKGTARAGASHVPGSPSDTQSEEKKGGVSMATINIKGMMCMHCVSHVDKALNAIDGVKATVSLENNNAVVELSKDVDDATLTKAVEDAGYEVTGIIR